MREATLPSSGKLRENLQKGAAKPSGETVQSQAALGTRNETGLPDALRTGIAHLSGTSMDDVKVPARNNPTNF